MKTPPAQIKDKVPVRRTTDMFMAIPMPEKDLQRFMVLVRSEPSFECRS